MTLEVQALFDDATTMHDAAMSQMIGGDIRDAAEEGVARPHLQATNAVILAQAGVLTGEDSSYKPGIEQTARGFHSF